MKAVAVKSSISAHVMVRELVDGRLTSTDNGSENTQ